MPKRYSKIKNIGSLLLAQNGLTYLSYSAFFSLASVYFVNVLNYSLPEAAWMLVYSSIVLRIARMSLSSIINLIPINIAFSGSLLLCFFGFLWLGFVNNPILVALAIVPIGLGYGINNTLVKYIISEMNDGNTAMDRFVKFGISINVGAAVGPLIGNIFISQHRQVALSLFCASIFFISFIMACVVTKNNNFYAKKLKWSNTIIQYLRQSNIRVYFLLSCAGWFFYSQLISSLPLFLSQALMAEKLIGFIFFINALIAIFAPIKIMKLIRLCISDERIILNLSFFLYVIGFMLLAFFPNMVSLFFSVIIISFGEILMLPTLNAYLTRIAPSEKRVAAFSLSALSVGIGEATGSFVGAHAINLGEKYRDWHLPFSFITAICIFLLFFIFRFSKKSF